MAFLYIAPTVLNRLGPRFAEIYTCSSEITIRNLHGILSLYDVLKTIYTLCHVLTAEATITGELTPLILIKPSSYPALKLLIFATCSVRRKQENNRTWSTICKLISHMNGSRQSAIFNQSSQLFLNGETQLLSFKFNTFFNGDVKVHLNLSVKWTKLWNFNRLKEFLTEIFNVTVTVIQYLKC